MSIPIRCPKCSHAYRLKDEYAGRRAKCRECGQIFEVPVGPLIPDETSRGGTPIYRHEPRAAPSGGMPDSTPWLEQISAHIERHIGPCPGVFHELVSEEVHLDLHIVPPTREPPSERHPLGTGHFTIVTSGMSARPMAVPDDEVPKYAELMIALPGDWLGLRSDGSFDEKVMDDERFWWPFRWLKMIARMPADYETFLAIGHTIPNGEAAEPFAPNTRLGCMMIMPTLLSPEAAELRISDEVTIPFYSLWALYPEEMQLKLDEGMEQLVEKFEAAELTELIQPNRRNTCA